MRRCYDVLASNHTRYKGVSVCTEWQDLHTFIAQVQLLPQWHLKLADWGGYDLDKDYYGARHYSAATCAWVTKSDNSSYTSSPILVTNPFGASEVFVCLAEVARRFHVPQQNLDYYFKGKKPIRTSKFLGYTFEEYKTAQLIRYALCQAT